MDPYDKNTILKIIQTIRKDRKPTLPDKEKKYFLKQHLIALKYTLNPKVYCIMFLFMHLINNA